MPSNTFPLSPTEVSALFTIRDQTHLFHLQTRSFAEHSALGSFYTQWTDLMDTFLETAAESSSGSSIPVPRITPLDKYTTSAATCVFLRDNVLPFVLTIIARLSDSDDTEVANSGLLNILADMVNLTNHTCYKLTLS